MKIVTHSLEGIIVNHHLLSDLFSKQSSAGVSSEDCQEAKDWRQEIKAAITNLNDTFKLCYAETPAMCALASSSISYLSMLRNVFIEDLELLFGKAGSEESKRIYKKMQSWPSSPNAREAIWYAGQVFRFFESVEKPSNFVFVMVYQAGLVLLGYSWLRAQMPETIANFVTTAPILCLNGSESSKAEDFFNSGFGEPVLKCNLQDAVPITLHLVPDDVVGMVARTMLNRTCERDELSQQLVNGLAQLFNDIIPTVLENGDNLSIGQSFTSSRLGYIGAE